MLDEPFTNSESLLGSEALHIFACLPAHWGHVLRAKFIENGEENVDVDERGALEVHKDTSLFPTKAPRCAL